MPYRSYYQENIADPYTLQSHEPGKDHGLWDVIGRAIRSTVPERTNPGFDKAQPVSDTNTPYQKPGFFRALLGDKGRDYNTDAMLRQRDMDTADTMEGKNFGAWKKGTDYENELELGSLEKQFKNSRDLHQMDNDARVSLENLNQRGAREIADTTGLNWLRREAERNRGRMDEARYRLRHPYSQKLDSSTIRLNNARAADLERKGLPFDAGDPAPTGGNFGSKAGTLGASIGNTLGHVFPGLKQLTSRIKIKDEDRPGAGQSTHPADMKSSGAVQNGYAPAGYDYDGSPFDDDDDEPYPTNFGF